MRKVLVIAALAALAILLDSGMASARGRKCGGGRHHRGGGCGGGGCYVGGCGGGYGYGGCGGYASGGGCGGYASADGGFDGGYALLNAGTTATVVVDLPADSTLTIDGEATTSTSATRVFQTPELEPGKTFHYTFQAQVERDGKVQTVERRVEVRAGEQTRVSLTPPAATVAAR